MARQLRLHVPGGFYHVTLRGNHRLPIFFTEQDRGLLDSIVEKVITTQNARVHAFCWMTNHLHLLIQISDVPLGRLVLRIASRYARTVQARIGTTGHLFERRYHCKLVEDDSYLLALVRYIHLNPVHGGMTTDPAGYRWSSHREYLGISARAWVTTGFVMKLLAADCASARTKYLELMQCIEGSALDEDRGAEIQAPTCSPDDRAFTKGIPTIPWTPRSKSHLDEIVEECSKRFGISSELLSSPKKSRKYTMARAWAAHKVQTSRAASISAVARRFNRDESSIREAMNRYPREVFAADFRSSSLEIPESPTRHRGGG